MRQFNIIVIIWLMSMVLTGCFGYYNHRDIYSKADIKYSPGYVANANSSLRIDGMYVNFGYLENGEEVRATTVYRLWPDGTFLKESDDDIWGMYRIEGGSIIVNFYDLSSPYHNYRSWRDTISIINDSTIAHKRRVAMNKYEEDIFTFKHLERIPKPNSPLRNCKWLISK